MIPRNVDAQFGTTANLEPEIQKAPETGPDLSHFQSENLKHSKVVPFSLGAGLEFCRCELYQSPCEPRAPSKSQGDKPSPRQI